MRKREQEHGEVHEGTQKQTSATAAEDLTTSPKVTSLRDICEKLVRIDSVLNAQMKIQNEILQILLNFAKDFQFVRNSLKGSQEQNVLENVLVNIVEILEGIHQLKLDSFDPHHPESAQRLHKNMLVFKKKIEQILKQVGIEPFSSIGKPYDPQRHEVVDKRYAPEMPPEVVVEEYERGYWYPAQGQIFRRAKVVISTKERRR